MFEFVKKFFASSKSAAKKRSFAAARHTRWSDWVYSNGKINADLRQDFEGMVYRARELAKNNEFCAGILRNLRRNVIGPGGFVLQSRCSNAELRELIEREWRHSQHRGALTIDESMGGREFDNLILRTLIIDGEVFIRRAFDGQHWRYEIIDTLEVDPHYLVPEDGHGGRVIMGIHLDERNREIGYFVRESDKDFYRAGKLRELPASEVLHLFFRDYPDQARGITAFAPLINNLSQLDGYKEAELVRARVQSCTMAVWERNGQQIGDTLDETDEKGEFIREIKPGIFPVAPEGYTAKFLQGNAPAGQFGGFWKDMLRSIANALGISYNKAASDYEAVNYSSLREAALEDRAGYEDLQNFFIEGWKNFEFVNFIKALAYTGAIPVELLEESKHHAFIGRRFEWVDPAKEMATLEREFVWRLTDPITEAERRGADIEDVLNRWQRYNKMLAERNLNSGDAPSPAIENNTEGTDDAE